MAPGMLTLLGAETESHRRPHSRRTELPGVWGDVLDAVCFREGGADYSLTKGAGMGVEVCTQTGTL